jgi:hypothetical protein
MESLQGHLKEHLIFINAPSDLYVGSIHVSVLKEVFHIEWRLREDFVLCGSVKAARKRADLDTSYNR